MPAATARTAPVLRASDEGDARAYLGHRLDWRLQGGDTDSALALFEALVRAGGERRSTSTSARTRPSTCSRER